MIAESSEWKIGVSLSGLLGRGGKLGLRQSHERRQRVSVYLHALGDNVVADSGIPHSQGSRIRKRQPPQGFGSACIDCHTYTLRLPATSRWGNPLPQCATRRCVARPSELG